ncbi:hypothetical protein AB4876_15660 [Zhongshania guokunii]|uniref:Uncharacterized protein n=1 Tax=Zhongshania guokunii TaxID=641783 RepID=A0ABV3U8Y0_9GAMM
MDLQMKKVNVVRLKSLAVGLMSVSTLSGCFSDSKAKSPAVVETSTFRVQMVDQSGTRLSTGSIKIVDAVGSEGDAPRFSLASDNKSKTEYSVVDDAVAGTGGVIDLNLLSSSSLISDDPLDVVFVGSAPNFVSSSSLQSITAPGDYLITITLTAINSPASVPVASQSTTGSATSAGGVTNTVADISSSTVTRAADSVSNTAAVKGSTAVTVPAGTQLKTSNGAPAAPGELTLTVVHFDNDTGADVDPDFVPSNGSLALFPGGLDTTIEDDDPSTPESGSFSSAGFAAIELRDSNGDLITEFSGNPVSIEITIPAGTPFPEGATGAGLVDTAPVGTVNAGDTVPVWTYNELTGKWKPQLDPDTGLPIIATVESKPDSTLFVSFETDHLTYFNLDYWYNYCNSSVYAPASFNVIDAAGQPNTRQFSLSYYQSSGGWARTKRAYSLDTFSSVDVYRAPNFPVVFELKEGSESLIATFEPAAGDPILSQNGKLSLSNICELDGGTIKLGKTNPGAPTNIPVDFTVVNSCSDIPSEFIAVSDATAFVTGGDSSVVNVPLGASTGTGTTNLSSNVAFIFSATADGSTNSTPTFTPAQVSDSGVRLVLGSQTCSTATGGTGATGSTGSTL